QCRKFPNRIMNKTSRDERPVYDESFSIGQLEKEHHEVGQYKQIGKPGNYMTRVMVSQRQHLSDKPPVK
ncbi:MAG: hypothetical protein M0R49_05450, partial [Limnochordia bacterium]|nr:hypothetical protein [Limnochordia bacterium]